MKKTIRIFSLCLVLIHLCACELIVGPSSQNVIEGTNATFYCYGAGLIFLSWTIDGAMVSNNTEEYRLITYTVMENTTDVIYSSLTISALPKYNGSSIVCFQHISFTNPKRYEARLHIQGLLNSVSNLSFELNTTSFYITWEAPFSLAGLDVWYNITIHGQDFNTNFLINSTNYVMPSSQFLACHEYKVSVASLNEAGMGGTSTVTKVIPTKLLAVQKPIVTDIFSNLAARTISANISIPVNLSCVTKDIRIVAEKLSDNSTEIIPLVYSEVELGYINVTLLDLPPDSLLNITITISTAIDSTAQSLTLSTFDTQSLQVTKHFNDTVCFDCSFVRNSIARGCKMIIEPHANNTCYRSQSKLLIYSDMHEVCFDGIFNGHYAIIVYDIDLDNTTSLLPAISLTEVEIIGRSCQNIDTKTVVFSGSPTSMIYSNNTVLPSITTIDNDTSSSKQTATILVSTFACLIIVIVIITIILLLYMKISKKIGHNAASQSEPCSTLKIQTVEEANKYIESIKNEAVYAVPDPPPNNNTSAFSNCNKYKMDKSYKMSDDEEEYVLMHSAGIHCSGTSLSNYVKHTSNNEYFLSQVSVPCKYLKSTYHHQDNSVL